MPRLIKLGLYTIGAGLASIPVSAMIGGGFGPCGPDGPVAEGLLYTAVLCLPAGLILCLVGAINFNLDAKKPDKTLFAADERR
jgi:hypothetical protein